MVVARRKKGKMTKKQCDNYRKKRKEKRSGKRKRKGKKREPPAVNGVDLPPNSLALMT